MKCFPYGQLPSVDIDKHHDGKPSNGPSEVAEHLFPGVSCASSLYIMYIPNGRSCTCTLQETDVLQLNFTWAPATRTTTFQ